MKKIGDLTKWGIIKGITNKDGERYYFIINKYNHTSLMPADIVEYQLNTPKQKKQMRDKREEYYNQ